MDPVTQLMDAIKADDSGRVSQLLDQQPELLRARLPQGVSALLLALYYGKPAIAQLFIDRNVDLDIFEASAAGHTARVGQLLDEDAPLANAVAPDGFGALGLACFFGHEETARLLIERGADVNAPAANATRVQPIHSATARRATGIVRLLLARGADPNARQQGGFTPLHAASQHGDTATVEVLLAAGADPTLAADDGRTASDFEARAAG